MKRCSRCKVEKKLDQFYARKNQRDGLDYYCIQCKGEIGLAYRKKNPHVGRENARRWRTNYPERAKATHRAWIEKNKRAYLFNAGQRHRKHRYGVSRAEYDAMIIECHGTCEICGDATPDLVIDHCHESEKIRGMICRQCNAGIGHFNESLVVLRRAAEYLEKHNAN